VRLDDVLRQDPALDLTLVAGPWDARIVERVGVLDEIAAVARARRGELVVLTRRASRNAAGRALVDLIEVAGRRELAAIALYGRATTSQAVIGAASGARVSVLAIGIGEDPAMLAFALEAVLRADPDAVLRRLVAAAAAIEHAEPDGPEAILIAASAELDAELRLRDGRVTADTDDTAVRIASRLVTDAIARTTAEVDLPVGGGTTIVAEPADRGGTDLLLLEALRAGRQAGWRVIRDDNGVRMTGEGDGGEVAARLVERLPFPAVFGVGDDLPQARAAAARARAAGSLDLAFAFDADDPNGLVRELAGSATARASAAGLLAPLDGLDGRKAATAIETLRVYLDSWGSLSRAGAVLHLHPNAVAHRMKRIRALLPVDLDDPDRRLALQIACRAWSGETPPR
jgi:PucR C-terminal helix-turn-helix domain